MLPVALSLLIVSSAWDEFERPPLARPRPPTARELSEVYEDVEKSIALWQAERAAFKQAQHEVKVTRDVRDLKALPWPGDEQPVEVVKNPGFKGGRGKVVQPKGKKLSPAEAQLQAELDAAEARAEDYRLKCREDPASCSKAAADKRRVDQGNEAFEEAARRRQEELDRKEQEIARRQKELEEQQKAMEEEAEKMKKAVDARRKATESQAKQNDAVLRGIVDGLSDE
ncbi:MAG: hypothetical protein AB1938_06565 [Myxococcota bacterium]